MTESAENELQTLLTAMLDGELSADQQRRLAECIRTDPQAKQTYLEHCELHAFLQWEHGLLGGMESLDVTASPEIPSSKAIRVSFVRRWLPAAAVALLAFGATLAVIEFGKTTNEVESASETSVAAVLSVVKDAQWERDSWVAGQALHDGQRLEIKTGLAEVTFASGAKLMLEGPSSLDVSSAWDATLRQGQVRAAIPTQAQGFRLISAEVEVDRGTEFSLLADEKGASELFVHEGTVEGSFRENNGAKRTPMTLRAKESRRFSKTGAADIQDRERKWVKLQRRLAQELPQQKETAIRWNFDGSGRDLYSAASNGAQLTDRTAAPALGSTADGFATTDGRRNTALRINSGCALAVPLTELSAAKPRTIAFWIRTQSQSAAEPLLAEWLVPGGKGGLRPLRISLNDGLEHGSRGALRMELGRFSVLSAAPIDDGKWHHVAWVFVVGEGGPPLQYVDGRLENATSRAVTAKPRKLVRQEKAEMNDGKLLIGGGSSVDVDELTHVDRALTPHEISQLADPAK